MCKGTYELPSLVQNMYNFSNNKNLTVFLRKRLKNVIALLYSRIKKKKKHVLLVAAGELQAGGKARSARTRAERED